MQIQHKLVNAFHLNEQSVTLLLNGKLSEHVIPELERSIEQARELHRRVVIDLSEVTLVDRKAVQYISEQAAHDLTVVNCPVYLRHWISQVSDDIEQ